MSRHPRQTGGNAGRLLLAAVLAAFAACPAFADAAEAPAAQRRIVVPYPMGGGTDLISRALAAKLNESVSSRIIVESRPGAAGIVGGELVAKAAPDGATVMLVVASHGINAASGRKLPYDT